MLLPFRLDGRRLFAGCLAVILTLALPACGRRGPLEAPPDASAPAAPVTTKSGKPAPADKRLRPGTTSQRAQPVAPASTLATQSAGIVADSPDGPDADDDDDPDQSSTLVNPQPTPSRKRGRAYTIPKEPFILDPLL